MQKTQGGNDRAINSNLINNRKDPEGLKRIRRTNEREIHVASIQKRNTARVKGNRDKDSFVNIRPPERNKTYRWKSPWIDQGLNVALVTNRRDLPRNPILAGTDPNRIKSLQMI